MSYFREEPLEQLADLNPDIEILVIEESKVSDSEVKVFTKVSTTKGTGAPNLQLNTKLDHCVLS